MRKLLLIVALTLFSSSVFGFDFHFDNVFADGSSPFDENNNTSPINYPTGPFPSPGLYGEGGEPFDLEGMRIKEQDGYIYIALANSYGYAAHSTAWNRDYNIGDLFIGKNGGEHAFAVDLGNIALGTQTTTGFYNVSGGNWNGLPQIPGSYGNYSSYDYITNQVGAFEINNQATNGSLVDIILNKQENYETDFGALASDGGDTYVWEIRINRALLGDFTTLDFHVTMACGNDVINKSFTAVPEPASMLLFGLGLAGAAMMRRRKKLI